MQSVPSFSMEESSNPDLYVASLADTVVAGPLVVTSSMEARIPLALIDIRTVYTCICSFEPTVAVARELAWASVMTGRMLPVAVVLLELTQIRFVGTLWPGPPMCADTLVPIWKVDAAPDYCNASVNYCLNLRMHAWVWVALIDVSLTVAPLVTRPARAAVFCDSIGTVAFVLAWMS